MKPSSVTLLAALCALSFCGLSSTSNARTMLDIPGIPIAGLRTYMPNEAYTKLVNAPVKAWILVRGQVKENKVYGARIAHSEANGVYDKIALQMANTMTVYSDLVGSRLASTVLIHVMIYGLPDKSEDALAFAENNALGANLIYSRSLMLRHLGLANQHPAANKPKKK